MSSPSDLPLHTPSPSPRISLGTISSAWPSLVSPQHSAFDQEAHCTCQHRLPSYHLTSYHAGVSKPPDLVLSAHLELWPSLMYLSDSILCRYSQIPGRAWVCSTHVTPNCQDLAMTHILPACPAQLHLPPYDFGLCHS